MADLYIARRGDLFHSIATDISTPKPTTIQERVDYVMGFNQDIGKGSMVMQNDLLLLNPDIRNHYAQNKEYQALRTEFRSLHDGAFNSLVELGGDQTLMMIQAVTDFLQDQDWYSHAGDLNGFSGAGLSTVTTRTSKFVEALADIEKMLEQYGKAPSLEKAKLKARINEAYQSLNQRFGNVMQRYFSKAGANQALHPVYSPRRAMKLANQGRYMSLTGSPGGRQAVSGLKSLNYLGKGILVLDLGFRGRNIYHADNRLRQTIMEAAGFGAAFFTGLIGAKIAMFLALGPAGWIVAIILTGVAAVGMDYFFKNRAGAAYDFVDTQLQYYKTPPMIQHLNPGF